MFSKFLFFAVVFFPAAASHSQNQFKVLHAFTGGLDGGGLYGGVALDAKGNVYGTASGGGEHGQGTVFQLALDPTGEWEETTLHSFPSWPEDGQGPAGGVALDASGKVYGTAGGGGTYHRGIVFELSPSEGGWAETVLYDFCRQPGCEDGAAPSAAPLLDGAGNLYGTAFVVYELSPETDASWRETVLDEFTGQNGDGYWPQAAPIIDAAGSLYGTTRGGGVQKSWCFALDQGCGTAYELQPRQASIGANWKKHILYRFGGYAADGRYPSSGLTPDRKGNLYGATEQGGANLCVDVGCGTVYKLTPPTSGSWTETIIYNFTLRAYGPGAGVTFDRAGNLYGTTIYGGGFGCGVIYKLSPASPTPDGAWQFSIVHTFDGSDGCQPGASLTLGPDGNLYGTTVTGGTGGYGVVFEFTP